jgi:hypothetical protein
MPWIIFVILFCASLCATPLRAVQNTATGNFNSTPPTSSDIPNWNTGWGAGSVTGWDYVGEINGAGGVYLGFGWVLTAGHVGAGTFTLPNGPGAGTYQVTGTSKSISNSAGTADLTLFQISNPPSPTALPPLILSVSLPVAFSATQAGSPVALLGFGGGHGLTWGFDTVTEINQSITPDGFSYVSNDFFTDNGTVVRGSSSITNNWTLGGDDSGGGDFTYNSATGKWELTGINEVTGSYSDYSGNFDGNGTFSGMVQLDTYAPQINGIVNPSLANDTPTMPLPALFVLACLLILAASRSLGTRRARG